MKEIFDYVVIDVQPTRAPICLSAVGAAERVLIPAEAATKGLNSLLAPLKFLEEQSSVMAFMGSSDFSLTATAKEMSIYISKFTS